MALNRAVSRLTPAARRIDCRLAPVGVRQIVHDLARCAESDRCRFACVCAL